MQQGAPSASRKPGGKPLPQQDFDDSGDFPRVGRASRFDDAPPRPWWRPASTGARVFLALGALVILGGLVTCVVLLRDFLDHDVRFRIAGSGNIQAAGLTEVTRADMLPVFGEDIGRNIFFVPIAERRRQLEQIPWVEHATVMRFLPDQIRVSVVERQPIAFVRQGQQVGLVDAGGVLLAMPASAMAKHHYSFPVVTGIDARDPLAGRRARMAVYQRLLAELDSGGQHFSEQISEIDLTDPEDARVLMPEPGADILAHFGEDHFLERYQRYKAHIAEWRQQYPKLAAVDLRYEQQVVLEMTHGAGAPHTVADGAPGASASGDAAGSRPSPAQPADSGAPTASTAVASPQSTAQKDTPTKGSARESAASRRKKAEAAKAKKKRAEAHNAALNANKPKPHPAAVPGQ